MSWNYRIIRTERSGGSEVFSVHEAYYDGDIPDQQELSRDRKPSSICDEPHQPTGITIADLKRDLQLMLQAFDRAVVDHEGYYVKARYERKRRRTIADDMNSQVRELRKDVKEWKRAFLKANSKRVMLQQQVEDLEKQLAVAKQARRSAGEVHLDHRPQDDLDTKAHGEG